jgi:hypothetical protein
MRLAVKPAAFCLWQICGNFPFDSLPTAARACLHRLRVCTAALLGLIDGPSIRRSLQLRSCVIALAGRQHIVIPVRGPNLDFLKNVGIRTVKNMLLQSSTTALKQWPTIRICCANLLTLPLSLSPKAILSSQLKIRSQCLALIRQPPRCDRS